MKLKFCIPFVLCNLLYLSLIAQVNYNGPANGFVMQGAVLNTQDGLFAKAKPQKQKFRLFLHEKSKEYIPPHQAFQDGETNFVIDPNYSVNKNSTMSQSKIIVKNFDGMRLVNSIPPDPYIAVGPNHIVQVVNIGMRITDKNGSNVVDIDPSEWFSPLINNVIPFDPKILFDTFDNRWITVWLHVDDATSSAYYILAVSDDSDPVGIWYAWALPSNVDGNTPSGRWADFPGVGFDEDAIYITSNNFPFGSGSVYPKIRIIDKQDVYINSQPGRVDWIDIWDFNYPGESISGFGIRPSIMRESGSKYYFAVTRLGIVNTTIGIYSLENSLTNPVLKGFPVTTHAYRETGSAPVQQLGGGEFPLEDGGLQMRHEPVVQSNVLHFAHSARNSNRIGVRYLAIDLSTNVTIQDILMGTSEHFHLYPNLDVNSSGDIVISYSRSSANEYAGAFFTTIPAETGLVTGSTTIIEGKGNYVLTGTDSDRNRWGDYNGVWVDPVDENTFWTLTEYARGTNVWGTRVAAVRMRPFDSAYLVADNTNLDFGQIIVGEEAVREFSISNLGEPNLTLSNYSFSSDEYSIVTAPSSLGTLDTQSVVVKFAPTGHSDVSIDTLYIQTNDSNNETVKVELRGSGFMSTQVTRNILYASLGEFPGGLGRLATIDPASGSGTIIEKTGFRPVNSITINPNSLQLYGLNTSNSLQTNLLLIRPNDAEATVVNELPSLTESLVFYDSQIIYAVTYDSQFVQYDLDNNTFSLIKDIGRKFGTLAVHPSTKVIYAASNDEITSDAIYTITTDGNLELVGSTGLGKNVKAITFNEMGEMFGTTGEENEFSTFYRINPSNASVLEIGATSLRGVMGLAYAIDGISRIADREGFISEYSISQNYPNPFNPSTIINYFLPEKSSVSIIVYNTIGEVVARLVDKTQNSGVFRIEFDGNTLASGLYIYEFNAVSQVSNKKSKISRKMMIIK